MDKEIRLGRFDKWGYKNSFSKGELARELTYMNRDYDKLEQQCKKQKEAINKIQMIITDMQLELIGIKPYHSFVVDGNIIRNMTKNIEDILKEM